MLGCLRGLGVEITECSDCDVCTDEGCFEVVGVGLNGLQEPSDVLYAGNSGTTTRLVAGLLAGQPFLSVLTGDDSLRVATDGGASSIPFERWARASWGAMAIPSCRCRCAAAT